MMKKPLVFISYANQNKNIAFKVCEALEKENIKCWISPRDISATDNYPNAIISAIKEIEIVVFLLSKHSLESPHTSIELERAISRKKAIITLRLEDIEPTGSFEYYIKLNQWLNIWDKPLELYLIQIVQEVKNHYSKTERGQMFPSNERISGSITIFPFPFGAFELKVSERKKSEILSFIQFLIMNGDPIIPPIRMRLSSNKWQLYFEEYIQNFLKSENIKKWIANRFELMLNKPVSLQNLTLVDALYILPPLRTEFDQVYDNLINFGRAAILGPKFSGKKLFILYLAYHWTILEYNKVWFIEDPNLISEYEWSTIENNFIILTADSNNSKKILFIIFDTDSINPEIDTKIKRVVNLASNTNLSVLLVSEKDLSSKSNVNYLQDLLRLPRVNDLVEINQNKHWKLLYKVWISSMLKLIFNINTNVLTNMVSEIQSIKELQENMDILKIIKMSEHFRQGKYQEIINKIEKNEKNIVLHQILIDSYLQIYNSDLAIEILVEREKFYQDHNNLGIWYYYYGKALILKGENENGIEKLQTSLEYLDSETHKDIKREIKEWTG